MQALSQSIVNGYIAKQDQQTLAPYKHTFKELITSNDIILRGNTVLIPSSLQPKAIWLANEGHWELVKTMQYARECIWFLGIYRKLPIAVEEFLPCQAVFNTRQQEPFKMAELLNGPWEHLQADLSWPLPSKDYELAVQCLYSQICWSDQICC